MKKVSLLLLFLWMVLVGFAQLPPVHAVFPKTSGNWARSVLDTLSIEGKIGQLFMCSAFSNGKQNSAEVEYLIKTYRIGGIIWMQGNPRSQVNLNNRYQMLSNIPLLVAQDAEWGLNMRLDSTIRFPKNMALGAIQDDSIIYRYGAELARQCKAVGVHLNFAPVVDVNNNPQNPVINDRSFGEDKYNVARKSVMLMRGMQDNGVIACAKHFPGHGDTESDSHHDLPIIPHGRTRLDTLELYPFVQQFCENVQSVMVAHLYLPAYETTINLPATLSYPIVTRLLKDSLDFPGIVLTDALNMQGANKYFSQDTLGILALLAGNDILLYPEKVSVMFQAILRAYQNGTIDKAWLDEKVYKILLAKEWLGIHQNRFVEPTLWETELNSPSALKLKQELYRAAITLLKNDNQLIPIQVTNPQETICLQVGYQQNTPFTNQVYQSIGVETLILPKEGLSPIQQDSLLMRLNAVNTVIIGIFDMNRQPAKNFGLSQGTLQLIERIASKGKKTILSVFGNAYSQRLIPNFEGAWLQCYDESVEAQSVAAETILSEFIPYGRIPVNGRLPSAIKKDSLTKRFVFGEPTTMGIKRNSLSQIDTLMSKCLEKKLFPGAVVMAMKGDTVFYAKGFGFTDYSAKVPVNPANTLYDLASVTKVTATLLAAMRLYEQGRLLLDEPIATYLPELKNTNKATIQVIQLLQHNAGFPPFIPFWKRTMNGKNVDPNWISKKMETPFTIPLNDSLFLNKNFPDSMWHWIQHCDLPNKGKVVYSDLSMIVLAKIIERILKMPLEWYLTETFYSPLGMTNTVFNPGMKCLNKPIAPTEIDDIWRLGTVSGYVHDENAALLGGVSGHAGLFSTGYDILKVLSMLRNNGLFARKRYLDSTTIELFTRPSLTYSRRGLGWDKPDINNKAASPTSEKASPQTYGHLGFTGTCVWIDPTNQLTYVFLSNRTYPVDTDMRFVQESIRVKVMDLLYGAIQN
ncbi:MAG: serine hydrolase [Bacteroidia bacterium]|nr:serine hydrolase [Bacteroidia bacterium]